MLQGLPIEDHGAAVPGVHAGQYVHQRGFARTVFPSSAWASPFPTEKSTLSSTVTPKNALEILHCSRRQLQRVLSKLCREGFLLRTGKGRYRLNPQPGTEEL